MPCPIGAVTGLHLEQVPSRLQALGLAFTKRIPGNNSPNYGCVSSAVILQRDEREDKEETCLPDSLALLLGYLYASSSRLQDTRLPFFTRLPDVNSSDHGPDSSANTLQMDETEGDMIHCRPSPLAMLLVYMPASLQSPPSHWPSPRYDDCISSGLRVLYRCPLRGPPISPARRGNGSCNCVRS